MLTTYLVRTQADQTLLGVFCASSPKALMQILAPMADPQDCEYLALQANEGLFVEAQFVHLPAITPGSSDSVFLTNVPEQYANLDEESVQEGTSRLECAEGTPLHAALAEQIPPVLEPTEGLQSRLQIAEKRGWTALCDTRADRSPASVSTQMPAVRVLCGESARRH